MTALGGTGGNSIPIFQFPSDLRSLTDYLFTDPTTGTAAIPWFHDLVGRLASSTIDYKPPLTVDFGGALGGAGPGNFTLHYRADPKIAQGQYLLDQDTQSLPFLGWWGGSDPRSDILAELAKYPQLSTMGADELSLLPQFSGVVADAAIRHRLAGMGVAEPDIENALETLLNYTGQSYDPKFNPTGVNYPTLDLNTGSYVYDSEKNGQSTISADMPLDDPMRPFMDAILGSLDAPYLQADTIHLNDNQNSKDKIIPDAADPYRSWGYNPNPNKPLPITDYTANLDDFQLQDALRATGIDYTSTGTSTALNQGGTPLASDSTTATTATGQTIQPLNVFSPFQSLLAGGYTYLDSQGKPQFVKQTPEQWANVYGTSGIFGQQQASDIADLFHTIPINEQEQAARDLLSTDKATRNAAIAKYPEMQKALAGINNTLLPGLKELATTGFRTPTPDLYGPQQYDMAESWAETGNRKPLEDAASTYMNRVLGPQMLAKYAGSLGSFGTDFGGELANQGRIFSADIADTVNNNQKFGLGMWNDMSGGQGLLDSQLGESAAQRRATGQALYQQGLLLPQNFLNAQARDLADIGGNFRSTDELLRPGRQELGIFQQLAQGAAPGNVGYIAQGKTPSSSSQLLNGLAGQAANFGGANLGGLASNFVGSLLNSSLLKGGGVDDTGNFGFLGDALGGLGSLLGSGASSLFGALSGLFGGGGGDPYGDSNYGGSDYNPYGGPIYA